MNEQEIELLESVNVPMFALEMDDADDPVYVAYNKVARRIAKLSLSQVLGKTALDLYPGRLGKVAYARHCETMACGAPNTYELTLPLDGKERYVRTHLEPIFDCQGQVIRLIGTSEEISAEFAVREAQANSVLINTELEEFVNLAATDLRSPDGNVSALADLIREELRDRDNDKLELVDMLETVASAAMALITDVLSRAHNAGRAEPIEEFELAALSEEILLLLDPGDQHLVQIEPCRIFGDRIATQIVLRTLIDSAIKQLDGNPIELAVTAESVGEQTYLIRVVDEGVGFSALALDFLNGGEYSEGLSEELVGIRRLIDARGGSLLTQRSASGHGSMIEFTLPGSLLGHSYLSPMAD